MRTTSIILITLFYFASCANNSIESNHSKPLQLAESVKKDSNHLYLTHVVNPSQSRLAFYWKDSQEQTLQTFKNLQNHLKPNPLVFAMNGGMFLQDYSPQGLYIEKGKLIKKLNKKQNAYGNFYLQPNGVFLLYKNKTAAVIKSTALNIDSTIEYATQSGPMLVIDSVIHNQFTQGSKNTHIRNGVGILPNGDVLFIISKRRVNLYDFASYFLKQGCKNALYLDGFVSRCYLPRKNWVQMDGRFGVMIAEIKR